MNSWNYVSSKKKKELLFNLKKKYIGKTVIGKFNKNKNLDFVNDIINNKEIKNIYLIDNTKCFIIGDIIEIKITEIEESNNDFTYFGTFVNVIRRKFHRLFGIIYKFDYQYYYIFSNLLGKKYIIKTTNTKNFNLLDKVIFEIQNYQTSNNLFVKIKNVLGNLKNNNEIFDTILLEENFIDCNNLTPLLTDVNNINEIIDNKNNNSYNLINNPQDIFLNIEDLTNFENTPNLDNLQFNKNYDKEQLVNTKIDYKLKNENLNFNALYYDNNIFIYKFNSNRSLQIGFLVDYFIGNRNTYNSGKQLFYRNLYTSNLKSNNNDKFLNNNYNKYYQIYNNYKSKDDFIDFINSKKQNKLWVIDINIENNSINNYSFHNSNIKFVDNLDYDFKLNILNIKSNLFKYYYQTFNNDNLYINIIYSKLKSLLLNDISKNVDYIPIRKINKYEYINLNNENKNDNNLEKINNSYYYINNFNENNESENLNLDEMLKMIKNSSLLEIKQNFDLNISYSNIVSFKENIFFDQINDYFNQNYCSYYKIYNKLLNKHIKSNSIYKPKNIYLIDALELNDNTNIDTFFNPYNDFFDSYVLKLIFKIKKLNIKNILLKENYDTNIFKVLENCNISEKICYKVEQRIHYYLLFNEISNFKNKYLDGKIIYKKNNSLFLDININNFHYILNLYDIENKNKNIDDYIKFYLTNYDIVKKDIFIKS
jgi:hypothetical protein